MRSKEFATDGRRVVVVIADKGDDAPTVIADAVRRHGVGAAQITGVGAFQAATLGYYDRHRRDYDHIPVTEQVEVLSLIGDVAERNGEPAVHMHVVLGRQDGSTVGGHLLNGDVWPTLEVIVTEVGPQLAKRFDPETGLTLIAAE